MRQTLSFTPSAKSEFLAGARHTTPLIIAATPFAVIYGALAIANGIPEWVIMAMSIFVFAGASQFIAVALIASGTPFAVIVLTVFVVNLRHLLYSASLMPQLAHVPRLLRVPMAFWMTDETFAIIKHRQTGDNDQAGFIPYYLGSALFMYSNWFFFSWVGMAMGQSIPDIANWGLDVAMVVAFVGIVVPALQRRADWACAFTAAISICLTHDWPHQTGLLFSSLLAIGVAMVIEYLQREVVK
ncbi:AzlC family ABC transporter permease [Leucothrix arctica]|uniref:Branched-chain amino acid ABC transporter permease n=1 Tax=Leucothrix arctica TaxID=1481894 RepID=A0A317CBC9_9GAMM|nr:AzlC family ABC transporter permease [Leucothrix arctica]PWQ95944.1 branched-chain amino acid ABC transporter permease [Leucothrix arctica]